MQRPIQDTIVKLQSCRFIAKKATNPAYFVGNVVFSYYSFLGKQATIISPISPGNKPPKIHPTTLLFLYPAMIGQAIILITVLIIPSTVAHVGTSNILLPPN